MSFPASFGSQIAAIMDVLAKAAVAEITKLVSDEAAVLRLEMCRRDSEIQELKTSLKLLEVELCKAQEAAASRETEEKPEQTAGNQECGKDEDQETFAVYLEPKNADSVFQPQCETVQSSDMRPVVKCEPVDQHATLETTTDNTTTARANVHFEAAEPDDSIWHPPACSLFEKNSFDAEHEMQHHIHIFPSHDERHSHRNTESSFHSQSTAAEEIRDDSVHVPVKVQQEMPPMCLGSTTPVSVHYEQYGHASHAALTGDQFVQSTSQLVGLSPATENFTAHTLRSNAEDQTLSRNNMRAKRLQNMWRINQKPFNCSVCNKGFPRLSQLEAHKATHEPLKPFRCLKCGKSFTQKTRLKTHQSVHTGERPFSCKICGKMFSRQDNCLRHERFHSGLKPYSCGQCGKSFTVLGNLKIHQELHLRR